jgi:hypothetical protein
LSSHSSNNAWRRRVEGDPPRLCRPPGFGLAATGLAKRHVAEQAALIAAALGQAAAAAGSDAATDTVRKAGQANS